MNILRKFARRWHDCQSFKNMWDDACYVHDYSVMVEGREEDDGYRRTRIGEFLVCLWWNAGILLGIVSFPEY